jgi:DNA mismatch endonuclease (patch repair protein)
MAAIKGSNTKPELAVRSALHRAGLRFRLHRKDLPGRPDIVLPKYKTVIFVHGCFWHRHGCANSVMPKTRREFWEEKLEGNRRRDSRQQEALRKAGWKVIIIWECAVRRDHETVVRRIVDRLHALAHSVVSD